MDRDDLWPDELLAGLETRAQPAGDGLVALGVVGGDGRHRALAAGVEVFVLVLERFDSQAIKRSGTTKPSTSFTPPAFKSASIVLSRSRAFSGSPGNSRKKTHASPLATPPSSLPVRPQPSALAGRWPPGRIRPGVFFRAEPRCARLRRAKGGVRMDVDEACISISLISITIPSDRSEG